MGELILNNKGLQTQKGVLKQKIDKRNSTPTSISSGQNKKLFLVDEDNDTSSQGMNEVPREHAPQEDENEEIENMMFENTGYEIEGDDMTSQDSDQAHRLEDGAEDVMDDEMEHMTFKKVQNGSDEDASEDNLENDDYELVQRQDRLHLQKEAAISTNKKRGPTMMHGVHTRKFDKREVIICNEFGQPIGPVIEGKDIVGEFSLFLGSIARMYSYAPLTCKSWHKVPHKDKMWDYVQEKYIVPSGAKEWVLMTIGCCWRGYKCRTKKKHFYDLKDNKTRWKNRPKSIPEKDFSDLLRLWNKRDESLFTCEEYTHVSEEHAHKTGPRSFARIREEMTNEDPNKEPPSLSQMFERTRKRKEGNVYVETYDDTARKVEQMRNYKPLEDGSAPVDPFHVVMGKEYDGHRRLFGKGVTNKLIKKNGGETSCMVPREYMESMKALEAKERQLVEMGNKLEEEHERKNIELEEFHERKKAEFQAMQDKVVEVATQKLIEKLPPGVARDLFT